MTKNDLKHLGKRAAEVAHYSIEDRINFINSPRWIGHGMAVSVLSKLEDLIVHPKTNRMPNLLIVGDTNNGKTMLLRRFFDQHLPKDNPSGDSITYPVFLLQAPPIPDEKRFYNTILEELYVPYKSTDRVEKKFLQCIKVLKQINVKMMIIDEIHHILAGPDKRQRQFLNIIKYFGNELCIPIVVAGIKDAFSAIQSDPQLANRFEPVVIPRWGYDAEYKKLLMSFERMIPLKSPSFLHSDKIARKILQLSEGTIGEISSLLYRSAIFAIKKGIESITYDVLSDLDWTPPSERKRMINRL